MNPRSEKVELRLASTASSLRRLPACAALASLAVSSPKSSLRVSVYWDTRELDLRAARIALRTRRIDDRAWVQTLMTEERGPASLDEYEARLPGQRPDLKLARQAGWQGHVELDDREDRLRPLFVSRIVRATRTAEFADGTKVDLCVDRGELRGGDLPSWRERIVEIKLELIDGSAYRPYELAYRLVRELPSARILFASESDRGYARSGGTAAEPRRALDIVVPGRSTPEVVAVSAAA
jgi:inorganic triphosphatase YgiF